jgi:HSP20 family protein
MQKFLQKGLKKNFTKVRKGQKNYCIFKNACYNIIISTQGRRVLTINTTYIFKEEFNMFGLTPFNNRNTPRISNDFVDFYNMVDDFFSNSMSPLRSLSRENIKADVRENDNEYLVDAELPGVKKEEINLDLNDDVLSISVQREERVDEKKENYIHKERICSSMERSLYLENAAKEGIKAKFDNGILSITVPKTKNNNTKSRIEIE